MKKKIRDSYYIIKEVLTKEYLLYLALLLIGINIYVLIGKDVVNDLPLKLLKTLCDNYYIILLISIICFYALLILKKYQNRAELITRYNNKKEFFNFIFKKIFIVFTFIYILSLILLFIFINFKFYFIYPNTLYYFYNISSYIYIIWEVIRNYIFMLFITYVVSYLYFQFENKTYSYLLILYVSYILLLSGVNLNRSPILFIDFLFREFSTFTNEICYFLIIYIIKFYLFYFLINIIKRIRINSIIDNNIVKSVKRYFYKVLYYLNHSYIPLVLYIIINIFNLYYIGKDFYNYKYILIFINVRELSFIMFSTKIISLLSFVLFCMKNYSLDVSKNSCLIFTRMSKKKWIIKKIILTICLLLLFRLPLYYLTGFNLNCIKDFIVYLAIGIMSIYYLLNESNINIVILLLSIVIYIFVLIESIRNVIIFIILLLIMYIINKRIRS